MIRRLAVVALTSGCSVIASRSTPKLAGDRLACSGYTAPALDGVVAVPTAIIATVLLVESIAHPDDDARALVGVTAAGAAVVAAFYGASMAYGVHAADQCTRNAGTARWQLTLAASRAARAGDCAALDAIGAKVQELDPVFYGGDYTSHLEYVRCTPEIRAAAARRALPAILFTTAQSRARAGDCATANALAPRVNGLDPEFYARVFAADPAIAGCAPRPP